MSKKTIRCQTHGLMGRYTSAPVAWEDIWISWKGKPGRTTYKASPCVICSAELEFDMWLHDKIRREQNEPDWYLDEDENAREALATLERQEYAVMGVDASLQIVTKAKGIDRKEAERMLAWYLLRYHRVRNPKFSWQRSEYLVASTGFGDYAELDINAHEDRENIPHE